MNSLRTAIKVLKQWRLVLSLILKRIWRMKVRLFSNPTDNGLSEARFLKALRPNHKNIRAFVEGLSKRTKPIFFLEIENPEKFITTLDAICPGTNQRIVDRAEQICTHIFDLLGSGPTYLGEEIDWHSDFKSGHCWDTHTFYADIKPAPYPGGYDIKIPWELSRFQHLAWLGQAYWLSTDEKYAKEFVEQVSDWLKQNPWPYGVNWSCTMDVAIRAVNWLWGYYFFKNSPSLTDAFLSKFFNSLLIHGRHIFHNLERSLSLTNNHYLSDIVGLVYLGILLPEFKEARTWREFGLRELEKEMFLQVYPDGFYFEASTAYHRLATELILSATLLARLNGYHLSSAFMGRLEKMLVVIQYLTRSNGTVSLIGDNDNGRLHRLKTWIESTSEWTDYRYLLAIGAVLFDRLDFAQAAGDQWEEAIWFFGEKALEYRKRAIGENLPYPASISRCFPDSGIYILRDMDIHFTVNAGQNGQNGRGGHAHNDKLSYTLQSSGEDWFVDPGIFLYTGDYIERDIFRSTSYHSTVQVDSQDQNRSYPNDLFRLMPDAQITIHRWVTSHEFDFLDASHSGYGRMTQPIFHRRQFYFQKGINPCFVIRDILTGEGEHTLELFFRVGNVQIDTVTPGFYRLISNNQPLTQLGLLQPGNDISIAEIDSSWCSPGYGIKTPGIVIKLKKVGILPVEFLTFFLWSKSSEIYQSDIENAWKAIQPTVQEVFDTIPK